MFCSLVAESKNPPDDRPYAVVLGIAQDGGYPHAGCVKLCCKDLWDNKTSYREKVSSIAIIDPRTRLAWIIDATPDFHFSYLLQRPQPKCREKNQAQADLCAG